MADFDALPRGVKALSRGEDVIRYAARVGGPGGVCTFGEFETAHAAGAAWDTEMRRRFPIPAGGSPLALLGSWAEAVGKPVGRQEGEAQASDGQGEGIPEAHPR